MSTKLSERVTELEVEMRFLKDAAKAAAAERAEILTALKSLQTTQAAFFNQAKGGKIVLFALLAIGGSPLVIWLAPKIAPFIFAKP